MFDFLRRAAKPVAIARRRFEAAVVNRLTASWRNVNNAIDFELASDLDRLRGRSRDLFKNNEYAAKFGRLVKTNVVGPEGFAVQPRATDPGGKLDALANKAIADAFWKWQRPDQCDVTGKRSFPELCRGAVLALARDGEYMIRKRKGSGAGGFGYQLQLVDIDRLDTTLNVPATTNRNAIVMGVEVDEWRKPVAYHLWDYPPGTMYAARGRRERVPASEMFHGFIPLADEQTRGVPWMHAVMRRLNDLNGYREAAIIAARVGASKMGFFTTPDGEPPIGEDKTDGTTITEATPGTFETLPSGTSFESFNPDYPHDQFDAFCKATLRGIASGLPCSYHSLANDLEGVSFSSIRSGTLEERDEWMLIQNFLITTLLVPVYEDWLGMALLRGAILLPNGSALPLAKREKFLPHQWQGRRWQWVDPLKDITAMVLGIRNGVNSPQQVAAQTGRDIEEVVNDLAAFNALLKAKGVSLPQDAAIVVDASNAGDDTEPAQSGKKSGNVLPYPFPRRSGD